MTELERKRHAKAKAARDILNKAEAESRDLNSDERQQFDELDREITELDGDIKRAKRAAEFGGQGEGEFVEQTDEQRAAEAEEDRQRLAEHRDRNADRVAEVFAGLTDGDDRRVAQTLQEFRQHAFGSVPQDEQRFRLAFYRYMTVLGQVNDQLPPSEFRVLSTATNPGGGYLVPVTFERTLIEKARDFGVMRELATVQTTSTGEKITGAMEDTHGVAAWLATNAAYPESDEAFANWELSAYKAGTLMRVAEELLQDSAFDLEGYIARQYAARIGILENTAYVVGDGAGKPTGIAVTAGVGATLPAGNTNGFNTAGSQDHLIRLYHSVIQAYRNRGSWLMRDATALSVRLVKDSDGNYLWQPGLQAGQPDLLLGRPLHTDPDMPAMAANAKAILFGDFSYYTIRDVQGVGIQRLNELYAANGQVGFRAYHRTDGKLTNTDAVKALAMSAA